MRSECAPSDRTFPGWKLTARARPDDFVVRVPDRDTWNKKFQIRMALWLIQDSRGCLRSIPKINSLRATRQRPPGPTTIEMQHRGLFLRGSKPADKDNWPGVGARRSLGSARGWPRRYMCFRFNLSVSSRLDTPCANILWPGWMMRIMSFHTFNSSLPRSSRARAEIREALASLPGAELVVGGAILFGLLMAG